LAIGFAGAIGLGAVAIGLAAVAIGLGGAMGLGGAIGFGLAGALMGGAAGGAGGAGGVLGIQGCVSPDGRSIVPSPGFAAGADVALPCDTHPARASEKLRRYLA